MQELFQSGVKTEHSLMDYGSLKDSKDNDVGEKIQEFKHILKWVKKQSTLCHYQPLQSSKKPVSQYGFYLIKVESLGNLFFKKCYANSKVYATVVSKLVSTKLNRYYPKSSRIFKIVEQTNTYTYQLKEPLLFYFYTSPENQAVFSLEVLLSEHEEKTQGSTPVFGNYENVGSLQIDLSKERKGKQKKLLVSPNDYFHVSRQAESNVSPFANVLVNKSDAYKYLEKIIPQNTLCDPTDRIAGILGYVLPLSQNTLTDFALTPDAQGLNLNIFSIEISSSLIRESIAKAQNIIKNRYSLISKVNSNIRDVLLHTYFHNGWKTVCDKSTVLKEKVDIHLKTNQSNFSEIPINKKTQPANAYENQLKLKNQYKKYECEQQIELKLTFPQEQECVLIYQIVVDVNVRGQIQNNDKKQLPDILQQNILIPLCFAINSAKSIAHERHTSCTFNTGGGLTSFQSLKEVIEFNLKTIIQLKKSQSKAIAQSKNKIPSVLMDIDAVSNNKTVDNISHFSTKKLQNQIGFIDFQMRLIDKEHFQTETNLSLPIENLSSFNVSKIDIKDKIQNQKERIAKDTKKNLTIIKSNKLNIDFLKQIIMSEHQKQQISKVIINKKNNYYLKQALAKLLKQQIDKHFLNQQSKQLGNNLKNGPSHRGAMQLSNSHRQQQNKRVLYSLRMSKLQPQIICEHKFSKYLYYLFSNRLIYQKYLFKYEEVPLDIIKTQLSEINYNNCYFINFIQMSNYSNKVAKFPQVFYFKIRFYNHQEIRSELMTINKDTGEILLVNNQNSSTKIIHIEANISDQPTNFIMKFIQFIQFMYNGVVNIQIIDYFIGHSFGTLTIPLRNLLRKRRNQVIYIHDDLVYHSNTPKANIKVQLRAIRKMKHQIKLQSHLPQQPKEPSPAKKVQSKTQEKDLRLERIQRFKENRNKGTSIGQQSQFHTQTTSKINKMITKAYTHESTKIMVSYLKKQFFFLQIANKTDSNITYTVSINDEDKKWLQDNPLSGNDEITIVKDPSRLQKEDYEILTAYKKNQQKMLKCFQVNEEDQFEIGPRGKGYVLFCYLTVRRYKEWENKQNMNGQQLAVFNHERTISCSLINESKGSIQVIYAIQIIPIPEDSTIQLQFYRPANEQSLIHLPFIDSQYMSAKIDQILIDDPYVLVLHPINNSMPLIKKFTSVSTGIYIQLSNDVPLQSFKEFNILILNDIKKKQSIVGESRKQDKGNKSRSKIQSRMVIDVSEEINGPKIIRINMRVWGCLKVQAEVALWAQKQGVFQLNNQIFRQKDIKHFYLAGDDQEALKLYQDKKHKHQNHELFLIDEENAKTQISYSLLSSTPNTSFIYIHAIGANQALEQEESLKAKQFRYIQPLLRIVMQIETTIPSFKQMLRININKASQGIIQQPFTYKSNANKKTQFKIYSSDATLVWVKNNDNVFQLDSKAERKLHINFNTQKIIERSILSGCQGIVLGIKWEKGIDYYGFKFNIY